MGETTETTSGAVRAARLLHRFAPVLAVALLAAALWFLRRELHAYSFTEIAADIRAMPPLKILAALGIVALAYGTLTFYDALAFRYIGRPLAFGKIAFASFVAYAVSNSIGLANLAGSSVRYRIYSAWGLSLVEIAKIIAYCTASLWLGFFVLAGAAFTFYPFPLPDLLHVPAATVRPLGVFFLAVVAAVCIAVFRRSQRWRFGSWEFEPPSPELFSMQLPVSLLDWTLAACVLYSLLPQDAALHFPHFLAAFLFAHMAGLISHVPGGLGVFETAVVLILSPVISADRLVGPLLVYRALYFLLPLFVSALLFGGFELVRGKRAVGAVAGTLGRAARVVVPQTLAYAMLVSGAVLLFSAATPAHPGRMAWIAERLPAAVLEASHLVAAVGGISSVLLARALLRRLDAGYFFACAALAAGGAASLTKAWDVEGALLCFATLAALLPCRGYFDRRGALLAEPFTARWTATLSVVLLCAFWLGVYSYADVASPDGLFARLAGHGDASRFLRATAAVSAVVVCIALAQAFSPARPRPAPGTAAEMARAAEIVARSPQTSANLALLGDKRFLFSESGASFVMYGVGRRALIAMGGPVGEPADFPQLVGDFVRLCDETGREPAFYEVPPDHVDLYLDEGLSVLKLGEEARVNLDEFSLEGHEHRQFRHAHNKNRKDGYLFSVLEPEQTAARMAELEAVSNAWLKDKATREKGFSLGFFDRDYLARYPCAIIEKDARIVAFCNFWPGVPGDELSIDLMRYDDTAPNGAMAYLFVECMLWGKERGYRWFNLGMSPLAGLRDRTFAPLWNRFATALYEHGEHFYNFQGLHAYKDKFGPVWRPSFLATRGGLHLPAILTDITILVGGGLKGIISK